MIKIDPLSNFPEFLEPCAQWNWNAWGRHRGKSIEESINGYRNISQVNGKELALVAYIEGQAIGTAALIECDHNNYSHLRPWVAAVYVDEPHRRKGVASKLVESLQQAAKERGEQQLFLYTSSPNVYRSNGWNVLEIFEEDGIQLYLMTVDL